MDQFGVFEGEQRMQEASDVGNVFTWKWWEKPKGVWEEDTRELVAKRNYMLLSDRKIGWVVPSWKP